MSKKIKYIVVSFFLLFGWDHFLYAGPLTPGIPVSRFHIINRFHHAADAWTQGLVYSNGFLYESTGKYGKSSVRKIRLKTGEIESIQHLDDAFYGEGLTLMNKRLYQLTWKNNAGFIYRPHPLERIKTFTYPGEGWGLTHDGTFLIMSDGTPILRFLDTITFLESRRITVTENHKPVRHINELEYVNGKIYANIWKTNRIVIINPDSGRITAQMDLTGILGEDVRPPGVLNGIACDPVTNHLFVTGKWWPFVFEIEITTSLPPPGSPLP